MSKPSLVYAICISALLAACGGGGGSEPAQPPVIVPPPVTSVSVPLITNPTLPPSGVDAEAVAAFNTLNAETARCGFGQRNWNSQLAVAAVGHADYQLLNSVRGHFQTANTPGFTGVGFEDRYTAAGYTGPFVGTDENTSTIGSNNKAGAGANAIRTLLSGPYHAIGMLGGYTDIGIAVRNNIDAGSTNARVVIQVNPAYKVATGPQVPASTVQVRTYPCQGSTDVAYELREESPNPTPGRNLATNPIGGAIVVESPINGAVLVITSATVIPQGGGSAVPLLTPLTSSNDGNGLIRQHQAVLMPDVPLASSTTYVVNIAGTVSGVPFTTNFSYTTRN